MRVVEYQSAEEKLIRVAFQGERGAYSEDAVVKKWGVAAEPRPFRSLEDVFDAVINGKVDLGLVPVENSIEGSVTRTLDLLYRSDLRIQGEFILRVSHCLIANPGVTRNDIRKVYSHPQALGQTREYLARHGYEAVSFYDTAGSVSMIKELGLCDSGAVASKRAAEIYEMCVLDEGIETNGTNLTRFLVIGRGEQLPTGRDKTTIAFILQHSAGTLYRALGAFADKKINLTKIESKPLIEEPWEYIFFIDFEGHGDELLVREAMKDLSRVSRSLKVLGSYPKFRVQV